MALSGARRACVQYTTIQNTVCSADFSYTAATVDCSLYTVTCQSADEARLVAGSSLIPYTGAQTRLIDSVVDTVIL